MELSPLLGTVAMAKVTRTVCGQGSVPRGWQARAAANLGTRGQGQQSLPDKWGN